MKQLIGLTAFLTSLNLVDAGNIESWAEDSRIDLMGKSQGIGGDTLFRHTYTAVITVYRYPHKRHHINLLYAHVAAWLIENDKDRPDDEDSKIRVDTAIDDDDYDTSEVTFSIDFVEDVNVVPNANGNINYNGQAWALGEPEIWYALEGVVVDPVDVVVEVETEVQS